jgi:hypothetical protein
MMTFEEIVEHYKQEYLDLVERAKTESISTIELMKPLQMIYNLAMLKAAEVLHKS